jgi:hypothetical protein
MGIPMIQLNFRRTNNTRSKIISGNGITKRRASETKRTNSLSQLNLIAAFLAALER